MQIEKSWAQAKIQSQRGLNNGSQNLLELICALQQCGQKNQGLLTYRWEESTQGPPRKYYSLTSKGRDLLLEMDKAWKEIVETLDILRK